MLEAGELITLRTIDKKMPQNMTFCGIMNGRQFDQVFME